MSDIIATVNDTIATVNDITATVWLFETRAAFVEIVITTTAPQMSIRFRDDAGRVVIGEIVVKRKLIIGGRFRERGGRGRKTCGGRDDV